MTWVFCQVGFLSVVEGTCFGRTLMPWETGSPPSWFGQYRSQISHVLRPSRNASARSNHDVRKRQPSSSAYGAVQPPRSNPPRRSSSRPPGPWYTPSRLTIIDAVSFMASLLAGRCGDETTDPRETHRTREKRVVPRRHQRPAARAPFRPTAVRRNEVEPQKALTRRTRHVPGPRSILLRLARRLRHGRRSEPRGAVRPRRRAAARLDVPHAVVARDDRRAWRRSRHRRRLAAAARSRRRRRDHGRREVRLSRVARE